MYNVYFDSGTTNTRAYLIRDYDVIDIKKYNIGSKDSSIEGNNLVLIKGLKELYDKLLLDSDLKDNEIAGIYASGMVTCPFGIKEIPHLSTPISLKTLHDGIYTHYEDKLFNRNLYLIRGAKTIADSFKVDKHNIVDVNNMRGEEIEIFGILSELPKEFKDMNIAIFLPGSHTHIAYIKEGIFHDILSTFSGELFYAISTGTILSGSIRSDEDKIDEEMVIYGFKNLKRYGFNRALYIGHAMKVFDVSNNVERKSYIEGVINGGVVLAFENIMKEKWKVDKVIITGSKNITKIYQLILNEMDQKIDIMERAVSGKESFAVKGLLQLMKMGDKR